MAKLGLLTNDETQSEEKQFKQIRTALENIDTWSSNIKCSKVVEYIDSDSEDKSFSNTSYSTIDGFSINFSLPTKLFQYNLKLMVSGNGYVGVYIDDSLFDEYYFNGNNIYINGIDSLVSSSGTHNISIKIRSLSGTVKKILNGKNRINIINFVA
jgi:hypothetical protein